MFSRDGSNCEVDVMNTLNLMVTSDFDSNTVLPNLNSGRKPTEFRSNLVRTQKVDRLLCFSEFRTFEITETLTRSSNEPTRLKIEVILNQGLI